MEPDTGVVVQLLCSQHRADGAQCKTGPEYCLNSCDKNTGFTVENSNNKRKIFHLKFVMSFSKCIRILQFVRG
jgi:hypothetical protein